MKGDGEVGGAPEASGDGTAREPKGAGGDWTEERRRSDEGRSRLKGARRRAGMALPGAISPE